MDEPEFVTRTRASYDVVAASYHELLRDELANMPYDRAMLAVFAELVSGRVADLGCGPGRITGHLASLGLDAFGIDLSPAMVDVARSQHPHLEFFVDSMSGLDVASGSLGGVVAWYSIIHTPPAQLLHVFAEAHRVLAPGGYALVAFKAGDEVRHLDSAYGHDDLSIDVFWLEPDHVASLATAAGFTEVSRLTRVADAREAGPQAYLLAQKPTNDG